jgi:IclR family transcriptional regulator, pca regulon regulatory protein
MPLATRTPAAPPRKWPPLCALPTRQRVTAGTQELAYVSMMEGDDIVYVARNGPNRLMSTGYMLGARVPVYVTAAGMLLLATRDAPRYDDWLAQQALRIFTQHTITDKAQLSVELAYIRPQDWAVSERQLELHYRGITGALPYPCATHAARRRAR